MNKYTIDENTGLPTLPAGRYWEVAEREYPTYRFSLALPLPDYGPKPGYTLHIREDKKTVSETNKNHRRERNPNYKGIFGDQPKWQDVWDTVTDEKVETVTHYSKDIGKFNKEEYMKAFKAYSVRLEEWKKVWGDRYTEHLRKVSTHNWRSDLYRPYSSTLAYYRTYSDPAPVWHGEPEPVAPSTSRFEDFTLCEDNIRHTAELIMAEIAEEAQRISLLGKYPPNKLG